MPLVARGSLGSIEGDPFTTYRSLGCRLALRDVSRRPFGASFGEVPSRRSHGRQRSSRGLLCAGPCLKVG